MNKEIKKVESVNEFPLEIVEKEKGRIENCSVVAVEEATFVKAEESDKIDDEAGIDKSTREILCNFPGPEKITEKNNEASFKKAWNVSPRGYKYFQLLSALQKDIRRGNEETAVFWATELESMGPKPTRALWNTLKKISTEDIGEANRIAPLVIYLMEIEYFDFKKTCNKKNPERLPLVNAVLFLANSLKSRVVDNLLNVVYGEKDLEKNPPKIPKYAIDMHTKEGPKGQVGIQAFFDEGSKLDREAIVDLYKDRAEAIQSEKEKRVRQKMD